MHWVIQKFSTESGYDELFQVLKTLELPMTEVKVIPFSHELEPKPEIENPIVVLGSTTLVKIAKSYGWGPGVWFNENFTYEKWFENWGEHLLNADSYVSRMGDLALTEPMFVRPVDDLKVFCGGLVNPAEFNEWQEKICRYDDGTITKDTLVAVARPKKIYSEYRFFVIDGKVVTGSQYKMGNRVIADGRVDEGITYWAQQRVDEWQPDVGFVIDVANAEEGLKVVEVNNLNSSGFYKINLGKLVDAIEKL